MTILGRSTTSNPIGRLRRNTTEMIGSSFESILIAVVSGALLWLVWIYTAAFRDPRYLDGWLLAAGMGLQLFFHIAVKTAMLAPKAATRWRRFHVFLGYVLIALFVSHSDFSLPDTGLEWALWAGFVLVTLSGIFGIYLAWSLRTKRGIKKDIKYERIPDLREELAQAIHAVVRTNDTDPTASALPVPPYDAWISELYTGHLKDFFKDLRNVTAHLMGSQRPLKRLTDEIDSLSRYVDSQGQEKLDVIKNLVMEKDDLDFACVHLALTKGWLFIHVPATYALIVLTILHILVVYAFSSGVW